MKKITIFTPTYNRASLLPRLYESIKAQTFRDFEWLIVDDGSTDDSGKILDEYKEKDTRIKVIHKENAGTGAARNDGLRIAKGECIGIINITNKKNGKLFNKKDLEFVEALANQAAIAVDNAQLYELATKDGLTKLYIHRHFYYLLETEMKRVQRYRHVLSLIMMDIDNFKKVNDTYGHLAGDVVLKEIAATIQKTIRHVDVPARYGGEEFTIILPETALLNAAIIAERLRQRISEIEVKVNDEVTIKPTVSIGIAEFPNASDDIKQLIDCADKALYASKESGKNCIHLYFDGEISRYEVK